MDPDSSPYITHDSIIAVSIFLSIPSFPASEIRPSSLRPVSNAEEHVVLYGHVRRSLLAVSRWHVTAALALHNF